MIENITGKNTKVTTIMRKLACGLKFGKTNRAKNHPAKAPINGPETSRNVSWKGRSHRPLSILFFVVINDRGIPISDAGTTMNVIKNGCISS
jgi:hypothetical protein